jgi:hypothetical protein
VKKIEFAAKEDKLEARISAKALGFAPSAVWCPGPPRESLPEPYPVPKAITMGVQSSEESARFNPPPFAVVVEAGDQKRLICVQATSGWHRWNFAMFKVREDGVSVELDLEGHTLAEEARRHVCAWVAGAQRLETRYEFLSRCIGHTYPQTRIKKPERIPSWWTRPIYCGWGDQVGMSLHLEGLGAEARAMAYCTQGYYERWIARLAEAGVPIGTVIIDAGWSPAGSLEPNPDRWPNLREFVDRQHAEGRRVLLWLGAWLCGGLPEEWCIYAGNTKLVVDPGDERYLSYLQRQVGRLVGSDSGCFDADGFKIDQLGFAPTEVRPRGGEEFGQTFTLEGEHAGLRSKASTWGCELLYHLQKTIYAAAKGTKPDALVTSSTVHPYFHDTFDMVRLHDTGSIDADVLQIMKARADLASAVLPDHLIDADDWVYDDYGKWLDYTLESYHLGVPCIFFAENFVISWSTLPCVKKVPLADLRRIAHRWETVGQGRG